MPKATTTTAPAKAAETNVNAEATAPAAETPVIDISTKKAEPTSEQLVKLTAERKALLVKAREFEPGSDDEAAILLDAYKKQQEMKAEIAAIINRENEAANQILKNQRVQLNTDQLEAYKALIMFEASNTITDESTDELKAEHAALQDAFKAANDIVNTELLAKFGTSKAAQAKTATGEASKSAADTTANTNAHIANITAGMTDAQSRKALEASGVARSTAWHTVNNYNKAQASGK